MTFHEEIPEKQSYKRGFKFEASWTIDRECQRIAQEAWNGEIVGTGPMQGVQSHLSACQQALSRWSWRKFERDADLLKQKTKFLLKLQSRDSPALQDSIKILQGEIDAILEREDIKWKQRAKQSWFRHGDRKM